MNDRANREHKPLSVTTEPACEASLSRRQARSSPVLVEHIPECTPVAYGITSESRVLYTNPAFEALTGYKAADLSSSDFFNLLSQGPDGIHSGAGSHLPSDFETKIVTKCGQERLVALSATSLGCSQSSRLLWTIVDLSKHQQEAQSLKQSERRYRAVFEFAPDMVILYGLDGTIIDANPVALNTWGVSREAAVGLNGPDRFWAKEDKARFPQIVEETLRRGEIYIEIKGEHSDGRNWFADSNAKVARLGDETFVVVIVRDTTERRALEDRLRSALDEKETLLREIHHRVKNNMQIISSLLTLQSCNTSHEKTRTLLRESQNRILAMAMIHERLYKSEGIQQLDFREYVTDLAREVLGSFGRQADNVSMNIEIDDITLGMDAAIPCGLIIIELISNALKHAFPENRQGKVLVSLHGDGNRGLRLTVSDNGIGIPEDLDIDHLKSLGLKLVRDLARYQLRGALELSSDRGTSIHVMFKGA
ncbi:MAG: histidine kinase dimerization/phosphoacceptor domain -containing protein [Syntrophobacteraceae bacterium]